MRAHARAAVVSMLVLGSVTVAFAGDDASKTTLPARHGGPEPCGSGATTAFGSQSGRLRVDTPLGADQPSASIASPSRPPAARAPEPAAARGQVEREKVLALLILMLKHDRAAR
jgi:hypothetical protein